MVARRMVMSSGMGARTGVFTMPQTSSEQNVHPAQLLAPDTLQQMDEEVSALLKESSARTMALITEHRVEWERLAQALMEHELLDAQQVRQAIAGEPITRKTVNKFQQPELEAKPAGGNKPQGVGGALPIPVPQVGGGNK